MELAAEHKELRVASLPVPACAELAAPAARRVILVAMAWFRDVVLVALLSSRMSVHDATAITLVSRVATTLADGISASSPAYPSAVRQYRSYGR
jgi:hypothetical protein